MIQIHKPKPIEWEKINEYTYMADVAGCKLLVSTGFNGGWYYAVNIGERVYDMEPSTSPTVTAESCKRWAERILETQLGKP